MVVNGVNGVKRVPNWGLPVMGIAMVLVVAQFVSEMHKELKWRADRRQRMNMGANIRLRMSETENISMCNYSDIFRSQAYDPNGCFARVNKAWAQVLETRRRDADKYSWFNESIEIPAPTMPYAVPQIVGIRGTRNASLDRQHVFMSNAR